MIEPAPGWAGKEGHASTVARLTLAAAAALAGLPAQQLGGPMAGQVLWVLALFLLPLPLLPAVMLVTVRAGLPGLGDLDFSDLIAIVYLVRLIVSGRVMDIRPAPSHVALIAFFGWAILVTVTQSGLLWPLIHVMLYAAVGVGLTHSPTARWGLLWAVLGLAGFEVAIHLPHLTTRLYGVFMSDPAQVGALLLAALLLVPMLSLPLGARVAVRALLLTGLAATQTRSIWFALAVVAVAAALPRRWYVPAVLPLVLAPVGLLLVPQVTAFFDLNQESAAIRSQAISVGMQQFLERPVIGYGWADDDLLGGPIYNLWIELGVATGLIGIALFLLYVFLLSSDTIRTSPAYLFLTGVLAMSLTEMPLYGASVVTLLFFTLTSPGPPSPFRWGARRRAAARTSPPERPSSPHGPPAAPGRTVAPAGADR
jgi:hypothetical protein